MKNDTSMAPVGESSGKILCGCFEFTTEDMKAEIAKHQGEGFDKILQATGIGSKCTACLLDLEYAFSSLYAEALTDAPKSGGSPKKRQSSGEFGTHWRRRIYKWIDGVAPLVPLNLQSPMPVVFGRKIESFALMANFSMMFDGEVCAPEFDFTLIVRDETGDEIDRFSSRVGPEGFERVNVSGKLRQRYPDVEIGVGSVEILQRAVSPGIRGTRRPQIEIVTEKAASALHGQAPYKAPASNYFICPNRPNDERAFLTIVSVSDRPMKLQVTKPTDLMKSADAAPEVVEVTVPAYGAKLVDLSLPDTLARIFTEELMTVRWEAAGGQKVHLLTASRNLDRIALDHL